MKESSLEIQYIKLKQEINRKNQLLLRQSQIKNYYLKEQISILLQEIAEYLDLIKQQIKYDDLISKYLQKFKKTVARLQSKRLTEKTWFQLILPSNEQILSSSQQTSVQTGLPLQSKKQQQYTQIDTQLLKIKQQNCNFANNINILTLQISIKQKQVMFLQQKCIKMKNKYSNLKAENLELKEQNRKNIISNLNMVKQTTDSQSLAQRRNNRKSSLHSYKYSWDRNNFNQKQKHYLLSQRNEQRIQQQNSNFFNLSETPLIEKRKDIPISTGFLATKKNIMKSKKISSLDSYKSIQNEISLKTDFKGIKIDLIRPFNINQVNSLIEKQIPHIFYESNFYSYQFREKYINIQMMLSQALTIQNLLEKM